MASNNLTSVPQYQPVPLTKQLHARVYEGIEPFQPQLSQSGKTVLVTGGTGGIGYAIAKNFGIAGATRVIVTGRTLERLDTATASLSRELKANNGVSSRTKYEGRLCQIADPSCIDHLFDELARDYIFVDVLVLNAALNVAGKLCDQGWKKTWEQFEVNVRAVHQICDRVGDQPSSPHKTQYIVNVSTGAIHDFGRIEGLSSYSLTKTTGALLLQKLAGEKDPRQMQIINFHPGAVFTQQTKEKGMTERSLNWDDVNLPGAFAVWCASPEAKFLHGRFVWAAWDVDELKHGPLHEKLRTDVDFLRIGVHGL